MLLLIKSGSCDLPKVNTNGRKMQNGEGMVVCKCMAGKRFGSLLNLINKLFRIKFLD